MLSAQGNVTTQATKPAAKPHEPSHPHKTVTGRHRVRHSAKSPAAAAAPPPAPPKPNWPAEQPPTPARVTWDSRGLAIQANNASLEQILNEVVTDTGVKLQGLNQDERVFGNFGPGPAREVLSQLLDGSGYNVLMIGGSGDAPPQQIILSRGVADGAQPLNAQNHAQAGNSDEDGEPINEPTQTYSEPAQPLPPRSPFGPGGPPRTPQQMQQEMLMRQQQNNPR